MRINDIRKNLKELEEYFGKITTSNIKITAIKNDYNYQQGMVGSEKNSYLNTKLVAEEQKRVLLVYESNKLFKKLTNNIINIKNEISLIPNNCVFELLEFKIDFHDKSYYSSYIQEIFLFNEFLQKNKLSFLKIFINSSKYDKTYVLFGSYNTKIKIDNIHLNNKKLKMENLSNLSNLFISIL